VKVGSDDGREDPRSSTEVTTELPNAMSLSPQIMSKSWDLKSHHEELTAFLPNSANVKSDGVSDTHEVGVSLELELPITTMERLLVRIDTVPVLLEQLRGDKDDMVFELAVGYDILPFVDDESRHESFRGYGSNLIVFHLQFRKRRSSLDIRLFRQGHV
jgi:hypothetical protein